MKSSVRPLFVSAAIAFFFMFALAAFAQEQPAPPPAPATAPATEPIPPPVAETEKEKPVALEKSTLRRIDTDPVGAPTPTIVIDGTSNRRVHRKGGHNDDDYVRFGADVHVQKGETIEGNVVGILSDVVVDGEGKNDVTAVLGDVTINGKVHGDVVAIMGDVVVGPNAVIDGDITTVRGDVRRESGSSVGGRITRQNMGKHRAPDAVQSWWDNAVSHGAWLGVGRGSGWHIVFSLVLLGFYALLALVFPGGVRRTGDMLAQRPAAVIFSAVLTVIALPVLFILLLVTVIGIPVALLALPAGVIIGIAFGKASIYALVGRAVSGDKFPIAASVLIGGVIFVLAYFTPVLGLALWVLTSALGWGCAVTALLSSGRKSAPPVRPVSPPPTTAFTTPPTAAAAASTPIITPVTVVDDGAARPVTPLTPSSNPFVAKPVIEVETTSAAAAQSPGFGAAATSTPPPPFTPEPLPSASAAFAAPPPKLPTMPNATLRRAGFWVRTAAVLLDLVLVAVILGPTGAAHLILPGLAAYGAVMWKYKGTTIGGIVCGLRVVRLDDRAIDWPTAVVRALGCFLSLAVAGLGFVWVIFDPERQSWHDKIAGTVVVLAPKGTSLV